MHRQAREKAKRGRHCNTAEVHLHGGYYLEEGAVEGRAIVCDWY